MSELYLKFPRQRLLLGSRARIMSTVDDNWQLQWHVTMSVVIVSRLWGWVGDGWQLINIKIIKSMVGWLGWRWQGNLIVQNSNWVIRKASKSCQSGRLKTHETFIFRWSLWRNLIYLQQQHGENTSGTLICRVKTHLDRENRAHCRGSHVNYVKHFVHELPSVKYHTVHLWNITQKM